MTTGDSDMVALLLEFGADRNAPATFWNYCCCKYTPLQFVDSGAGGCGGIPPEQRAPIKELLMISDAELGRRLRSTRELSEPV